MEHARESMRQGTVAAKSARLVSEITTRRSVAPVLDLQWVDESKSAVASSGKFLLNGRGLLVARDRGRQNAEAYPFQS